MERASDAGDRRSYSRAPLEVDVSMTSESQVFVGLSGDISEGGIFVSTYRALPMNAPVELSFTLPCGRTIAVVGHVRWTRQATEGGEPPGVGVKFESIDGDDLAAIAELCAVRPPLYFDDEEP